jgi:NADP-dependent 3-hydroxy acid dehydrogenase YdfG
MKQTNRFLIYGATGYTGKLAARTAKEKGLEPILAGRNEVKLKALGEPLGFQFRAFDLSDKAKLDAALGEVDAVVLLSQARVTAACNALHLIEARFCRWLLQSADRAASNTLTLTQELLAEMLGVRRTSVTEVASKIQGSGAISYSRGVIKILDRPALESLACECYQTLLNQQAELA